jgi:hypothetical protein
MLNINTESSSENAEELASGEYDLVILSASWDPRCLSVLRTDEIAAGQAVLLSFADKGSSGACVQHERALRAYGKKIAGEVGTVNIDSHDPMASWLALRRVFVECYKRVGRPISVLVDLTSTPRYITLSLLGFGGRSGLLSRYTAIYATASRYETLGKPDDGSIEFTRGRWYPSPIVGLGRPREAATRLHLVVSGGFEGAKTRKLTEALEPDRVSLVISAPGTSLENEKRAMEENRALVEAYRIPPEQIVGTPPFSLRETVERIQDLSLPTGSGDELRPEATAYLLCGMKPHALAMAIASFNVDVTAVFYALVDSHVETRGVGVLSHHRADIGGSSKLTGVQAAAGPPGGYAACP